VDNGELQLPLPRISRERAGKQLQKKNLGELLSFQRE
jgi:hypothetical protein